MKETHYAKFRRRTQRNATATHPLRASVVTANRGLLAIATTLFLCVLLAIDSAHAQDYATNEIPLNKELTEVEGGDIVGERTLRLAESPFLLRSDLEVAFGARLIVEPGVLVHVAPMVGITVRGALQAVVSFFFVFCFYIIL